MRVFLYKTIQFLILFIILFSIIIVIVNSLGKKLITFDIPESIEIIAIGDSHIECGLDDNTFTNIINFGKGGTSHFYMIDMLEKILSKNNIETIIISYSFDDIIDEKDSWFYEDKYINRNLPVYLPFLKLKHLNQIIKINFIETLSTLPKSIVSITKGILKRSIIYNSDYGGFNSSNTSNIETHLKQLSKEPIFSYFPSEYNIYFIKEMYDLVQTYNLKCILLNTPIHPKLYAHYETQIIEEYYKYAQLELSKALLIDCAQFELPENQFSDLEHLNAKGAKTFTEYLLPLLE